MQIVCSSYAKATLWPSRGLFEWHLHRGTRGEALWDAPWGRNKECCHFEVRFYSIVLWCQLMPTILWNTFYIFRLPMLLILTYRVCVHQGYLHIHRLMCRAGWRCKAHNLARPLHPSLPLQWYCGPMQLHTFVRCAEQWKGGREVRARPISSCRPGQKLARMPSGLTSPFLLHGWERWDAEHPARCYIGQSNMVSQITIIYKISFSPIYGHAFIILQLEY